MPIISKIYLDTTDSAASVITLKFEENETVGESLCRISRKLKMQLSNEEVQEKYALIIKGIPSARYFIKENRMIDYLNDECLKDSKKYILFVRKSFRIVIIAFNMENEYIYVDFCKEHELEKVLEVMAKKTGERQKDLYFVSASNPEKELQTQKTLIDLNLVHEDVLLLKTRKKKRKLTNKRIKGKRFKRSNSTILKTSGSLSSLPVKAANVKGLTLYLPPILFYSMRWIEANALNTPCIFQLRSNSTDVEEFKKTFDSGYIPDLDSASDPFVICDLLKIGLNNLAPCLDCSFWERFNNVTIDNPLVVVKLLSKLATPNIHILKHICCFLNTVASHSSTNRMNSEKLSQIFIQLISPGDKEFTQYDIGPLNLVQSIIDNPDIIPKKQHPPLINSFSSTNSTNLISVDSIKHFLLLTEEIQWQYDGVKLIGAKPHIFEGCLYVSNYRIIFHYKTTQSSEIFELPLACILSVTKKSKESSEIYINGKNFVCFQIQLVSSEDAQKVIDYLHTYNCPQALNKIFAFSYALFYEEEGKSPLQGLKNIYLNPEIEYSRQGVLIPSDWRYFSCKLSTSYPRQILIPSEINEEQKNVFPKSYKKGRFPTLVYHYSGANSCILMSSTLQSGYLFSIINTNHSLKPSSRISHTSSTEEISSMEVEKDSELIKTIKQLQPSGDIDIISCLKPNDLVKISSLQNKRKKIIFTDVNKIYPELRSYILAKDYNSAKPLIKEWEASLSEVILSSASASVDIIKGKSILFEDDEENNFGVISRVMIMTDPFYRTIKGFQRLIEHVWIRYGFPFASAIGIDCDNNNCSKIGVFVHFIDSIWQMYKQYPSCFEFNELFLIDFLNEVFYGCFGTFLANNEKQAFDNIPITVPIWNKLSDKNNIYKNRFYTCKDRSPLVPDTSNKSIKFWTGFFLQWTSNQGIVRFKSKKLKKKLKIIDISSYTLSYIPFSFIESINTDNIEEINLSMNNLTWFPLSISIIQNLKTIILSKNRISSITEDIFGVLQNLRKLTTLDLRDNNISFIDKSIKILTTLKNLHIGGNKEKANIDGIFNLTSLNQLSLERIGLIEIPDSILQLTNLKSLSLLDNKLTNITCISLPKLTNLCLAHNEIIKIGNINCKKLKQLDLSFNKLSDISKSILLLKRLNQFKIHNNNLERLSPTINLLSNLTHLDISNNKIKNISPNLYTIKKLETVRHTGNPIEYPPSHVVGKGTKVLLKFLEDKMNTSIPHRRIRLLLVGQENVGKSSISHYLKTNLPIQENISTDGIHINDWELKINTGNVVQPVDVKIWDFAGQEVYYSTHQLFLGGQSIYIVVWNIMNDERETRVRFWLESIKARTIGGSAAVILVATHIDHELCTQDYIRDSLQTIERKYCSKFPFIKNIIAVSCSTGEGFPQLRGIIKSVIGEQKYIGNFIPSKYLFLEKELLYKSKEIYPPVLSYEDFKSIALQFEINNDSLIEASNYLHDWGSIIHHNDPILKNMVILDPSWLVQVMATILTTKHRYIKGGILKHSDLVHIWYDTDYPREFHPSLLQLLEKFEVTYSLNNNNKENKNNNNDNNNNNNNNNNIENKWENGISLVPSVLPKEKPESAIQMFPKFENIEQYSREYKFNFIPEGFINHLLVRVINQTLECHYWRYGIAGYFKEDPSSKVLLELLPHLSILSVIIRGSIPVKYFLRIIDIIESFIESWFRLDVTIQVPCSHCFKNKIHPLYKFSFQECKDAAVHGESYVDCPSGTSVRMDVLVPDLSMAEVQKVNYSDIIIEKEIGKGGFATVYKALYNNQIVALKQIDIEEGLNMEDAYSDFMRESWIMNGIQHPNIIGFLGLCSNPLCIVTDFASKGNLFDFLHSENEEYKLSSNLISLKCKIMYDIAQGMYFLHNRTPPIIHADLKSPNILLHSINPKDSVVAVVADFGLSRTWVPVLQGRQVDNPVWLAPEILQGKKYSESADIYAFGVILYEIFTLKDFFGEFTFMSALEDAIMEGKRPILPDSIHNDFKILIEKCWHQIPTNRPSFSEIVDICKELISKHVSPDDITLQKIVELNSNSLNDIRDYSNQCLLHSMKSLSNITNIISINNNDDLWCVEKGFISIWNIYDSYLPEKQIPFSNPILQLEYFPKSKLLSNDIVCSLDKSGNIHIWDSNTVQLLKKKSFDLMGDIICIKRISPEELWMSSSLGFVLTINILTLQPALVHLTGFSETTSRVSSSIRNIHDKLSSMKHGIKKHNITINNISIFNCFTGNELLQWLKEQSYDDNTITEISNELLSKNHVIRALKQKKSKRKSKKLYENVYYVIKSDIATGIKLSLVSGIPVGFKFDIKELQDAKINCITKDISIPSRVWLGTTKGVVIFDLIRCGIIASINLGNINCLVVTESSIWISEKGKINIHIYNKYTLLQLREIEAHTNAITSLEYSSGVIWSSSIGSSIKIWSISHYCLLEDLSDYHNSSILLLKSISNSHVLSSDNEGNVAIWKYSKEKYLQFSSADIENLKYKYYGKELSDVSSNKTVEEIKLIMSDDINYISLKIDPNGMLQVETSLIRVDLLYEQLSSQDSTFVLYSYKSLLFSSPVLLFYLYNPNDSPQNHQILYNELFESVISIIESILGCKIKLSFVVDHETQLAEKYLLYQIKETMK